MEEEVGTCLQNFSSRSFESSAGKPKFRLSSRPLVEPKPHFFSESPPECLTSIAESEFVIIKEIVLKARVVFERKKFDLSIYIFDETLIEQSFQEALLDESLCFLQFQVFV